MSAIFSPCGQFRYRLEREIEYAPMLKRKTRLLIAWIGVNPSDAGEEVNDQSVRKMMGFSERAWAHGMMVGNLHARVSKDVKRLASFDDTGSCEGALNGLHVASIIDLCDLIIPCWGSRAKLPPRLRGAIDHMRATLAASGKPIRVLGLTKSGDPNHPLMLAYDTPLKGWSP